MLPAVLPLVLRVALVQVLLVALSVVGMLAPVLLVALALQ